ncbi:MAG: hypothetical protein MUF04_06765 [Akkermansiaceae bacterium]|nr:hypothetical protein [Akkermansiaceae bacterium]
MAEDPSIPRVVSFLKAGVLGDLILCFIPAILDPLLGVHQPFLCPIASAFGK